MQTVEVLSVLLAARGNVVSRTELMEQVRPDAHVTDDSLVQCISEIRKALGRIATIEALIDSASIADPAYREIFSEGFRLAGLPEN
ncbi:hypothetical protein HKCCSP123_03270 [Rhodobacterales bacterium HKCCSP123]|nr:hypothetical protein [Rhodobacterales bacterium HKCCSP123]